MNDMGKSYSSGSLPFILILLFVFAITSCKKDNKTAIPTAKNLTVVPAIATPKKLGLYEADSSIYKLLFMNVSKIGSQTVNDALVFDTGSGGMVIDAEGILPKSMITGTGFKFTGDSVVVNGITVMADTATVTYGNDDSSITKAHGNLAYAAVTLGDDNGNIVIKRLPFFLYYKGEDAKGNTLPSHYFDVIGVDDEYDLTFANNVNLTSPLSFYDPGNGLTKGFKMAALGTSNFSLAGNYVPDVITLGLTPGDLSSSGFVMNQLYFYPGEGYSPVVPATFIYNTSTVSTYILFDTGTEPYSYIEDSRAKVDIAQLPDNTNVSLRLTSGFNYQYTTTPTENLTYVENPATTGANISILSIEFFLNNEYLLDYTSHKLGLKNN